MSRIEPNAVTRAWEAVEQFEAHAGVARAGDKAERGQFATPRAVARALVRPVASAKRVLDPAVGGGALWVAWAEANLGAPIARLDALHGQDSDPAAVATARRVLAILRNGEARADAPEPQHGDSLLEPARAATYRRAFDAIISNPPWVSHSGRHARAVDSAHAARLAAGYAAYRGWPSLHGPFAELAARRLAPGGTMCLLLPAAVATGASYAATREAVTSYVRLRGSAARIDERAFGGVVQPSVLVVGDRLGTVCQGSRSAWAVSPAPSRALVPAWMAQLATLPRVPAHAFGDIGVHTGNAAQALILDAPCAGAVPIREGRDIGVGTLRAAQRWLRTDLVPVGRGRPGLRFRIGDLRRFARVPIVLRQTASRPVAAPHEPVAAFRNSVLASFGLEGVPHAVTVAWLNSALVGAWFGAMSLDTAQRTFPQIKLRELRALPMPAGGPLGLAALAPVVASGDTAAIDAAIGVAYGLDASACSALVASPLALGASR